MHTCHAHFSHQLFVINHFNGNEMLFKNQYPYSTFKTYLLSGLVVWECSVDLKQWYETYNLDCMPGKDEFYRWNWHTELMRCFFFRLNGAQSELYAYQQWTHHRCSWTRWLPRLAEDIVRSAFWDEVNIYHNRKFFLSAQQLCLFVMKARNKLKQFWAAKVKITLRDAVHESCSMPWR